MIILYNTRIHENMNRERCCLSLELYFVANKVTILEGHLENNNANQRVLAVCTM